MFDDVKIGDSVLINHSVYFGWRESNSFYLPMTVTRVSKTQFRVGDRRFRKGDGREIGGEWYAAVQQGSNTPFIKNCHDQTKEYNDFKKLITVYTNIRINMGTIGDKRNRVDKQNKNLARIDSLLTELLQLIEEE